MPGRGKGVTMKKNLPVLLMFAVLLGIIVYSFVHGSDACLVAGS